MLIFFIIKMGMVSCKKLKIKQLYMFVRVFIELITVKTRINSKLFGV